MMNKPGIALFTVAPLLLALSSAPVDAHGIVRREQSGMSIASSIAVPEGAELLFIGGTLADATNTEAVPGSRARFGDMAAQAHSVLGKIEAELAASGYAMGDIVKMEVYLVPDPDKGGAVDMLGLMSAYLAYFGKGPGRLPTRTTVQVAGLAVPGALVQIAVIAARTNHPAHE
jgi:enamine deaminase RidA (YjgF/YER057c/UK114 family)